MKKKIALVAVGLLAAMAGGFYYYTTTPSYSVLQIRESVESHDVALFEKHVDVDTLFNRLIDDVMAQQLAKSAGGEKDAWGKLGSAIGAGMVQMIKPTLVSGLKSSTLQYIETGDLSKQGSPTAGPTLPAGGATEKASLHGMAANFGMEEGQVLDYQIEQRGKVAMVTVPYRNEELDLPLQMQFTLRDQGGYWQLVQFNNAAELISTIEQEQQRRLVAANSRIEAELGSRVQFVGSEKHNEADKWEINKKVYLGVAFESMSDQPLKGWTGTLEVLDADLQPYFAFNANGEFDQPLARGMRETMVWKVDINQFMDGHKELWAAPEGKLNVRVKTSLVRFDDGTSIEKLGSYAELRKTKG
ncbi:DUF2939 domain-containing protein [Pseudomonas jinjuensis]|uniref:DUF2939 domain-containing protein n=1 Tax=Pseudomonas jinjuensis TaxID=198616 RepID=A0A1H0EG19_9PSED|nr:DUF2939 domain-containing protein [Pseudomonas jinjuensis]SDN81394.1 Protein of unknown function [Pseudomonas jinjuensis]